MLLCGLVCAVGSAFLLNFMFSGPKLGPHYDLVLSRKTPAVSRDILIINTEEYVESSDFFSVLMTLTEMEASKLVLTSRLSPVSTPITVTEAEIRRRFFDEYQLVGSNIRNLFEGIRMGSVSPAQAPVFVERLVELTEQGRDRLITSLIERDEDLIRSVAVFGNFMESYSRPQVDRDGRLRRVKPADTDFEHPVYQYFKLLPRAHNEKEVDLFLDSDGYIIAMGGSLFRRIDIELFREYEEKGNALLNLMAAANGLGAFSKTSPEKIPLFLGEYSLSLLEELLKTPNSENRFAWITSRANYFKNLEDYFNSPVDILIVNEYEEQIADTDPSNTRVITQLVGRRDELAKTFRLMREIYTELSFIHYKLKEELSMSFCVMGSELNAESSALLANVLITGSHVKPVKSWHVLFWSILSSFIVLAVIFMLRPFFMLAAGFILSFLSSAIFSGYFIYSSFWIDPVVVLGSSLAGILAVFLCKFTYLNYRALSFRSAYRAAVPKNILQNLIDRGKPGLSEVNVAYAAVVAIKDLNLFTRENNEKSKDAGKVKRAFYSTAKKALFNAGAVIAGFEGDTLLACFGSPLELKPALTTYKWAEDGTPIKTYHPVEKACAFVRQMLNNEKITWRFGIDVGECSFSWSPETGFSVSGQPAVRARILVSRTKRYQKRAVITDAVRKKLNMGGKKIGSLYNEDDWVFDLSSEQI